VAAPNDITGHSPGPAAQTIGSGSFDFGVVGPAPVRLRLAILETPTKRHDWADSSRRNAERWSDNSDLQAQIAGI